MKKTWEAKLISSVAGRKANSQPFLIEFSKNLESNFELMLCMCNCASLSSLIFSEFMSSLRMFFSGLGQVQQFLSRLGCQDKLLSKWSSSLSSGSFAFLRSSSSSAKKTKFSKFWLEFKFEALLTILLVCEIIIIFYHKLVVFIRSRTSFYCLSASCRPSPHPTTLVHFVFLHVIDPGTGQPGSC